MEEHYGRCGDVESSTTNLIFIKYELETDEEHKSRMSWLEKEVYRKEVEKKKKERIKLEAEEKEKKQLRELMTKYPGVAKNRKRKSGP